MKQRDGTEALERVRKLRKESTPAEVRLWQALRGRRLADAKFRRQVWLGPYIADFFCLDAGLVVELDGGRHAEQSHYDERHSAYLASKGLRVLRVWNNEAENNLEGVLTAIVDALRVPSPSHSASPSGALPLPGGEGK